MFCTRCVYSSPYNRAGLFVGRIEPGILVKNGTNIGPGVEAQEPARLRQQRQLPGMLLAKQHRDVGDEDRPQEELPAPGGRRRGGGECQDGGPQVVRDGVELRVLVAVLRQQRRQQRDRREVQQVPDRIHAAQPAERPVLHQTVEEQGPDFREVQRVYFAAVEGVRVIRGVDEDVEKRRVDFFEALGHRAARGLGNPELAQKPFTWYLF